MAVPLPFCNAIKMMLRGITMRFSPRSSTAIGFSRELPHNRGHGTQGHGNADMSTITGRLDSLLTVEAPEGVRLSLPLAGPVPRVLAFLIDLLIRGGILFLVTRLFGGLGHTGTGLYLLAAFLIEWFYPVLFEVYFHGATPGKRVMRLRVVESNGLPVGWSASLVRNLLRFADFLPFFYAFGFLSMMYSSRFQRLGDLAAGTVVIWRAPEARNPDLPEAPLCAPPVRLSLEEQQNLIEFAARCPDLSADRTIELSDLAAPVTGATGQTGLERLLGMAAYLAGKR